MKKLQELKKELEFVATMKNITSAILEFANLRMNQIKHEVLMHRKFFEELTSTYQRIKSAVLRKKLKRKEKKKKPELLIFLSANQTFYGSLIFEIWKMVKDYYSKNEKAELAVVGKVGKIIAEKEGFLPFYFELDDTFPEKEKISRIVDFARNYEKILVFHGKYERGLLQKATFTEISEKIPEQKKEKENLDYIFEPSPETILDFFEREIVGVLISNCILEHQLARYCARVLAMSEVQEKAKEFEKKLKIKEKKLKIELQNKRQVEMFCALSSQNIL